MDDMQNLDQILALNESQARARYNLGRRKLIDVAREAGALVRLGERKNLYLRQKLDDYFFASGESLM